MEINLHDSTQYKDQIKGLWAYAFSDTDPFLSVYFDRLWQGSNAVSVLEGNQVAGALELVPYTLVNRGRQINTSYIVGVSVAPQARGRGVAKILMRGALEKQRSRGEAVSLLLPFAYSFYAKMGYAPCYTQAFCRVPAGDFPAYRFKGRFVKATLEDHNALTRVYQAFCRGKNGFALRSYEQWRYIFENLSISDGHVYAYVDESGTMTAYISFINRAGQFKALELACIDAAGLEALLGFSASHFSTVKSIEMLLPNSTLLPYLFREPPVCELRPSVMGRILDLGQVLTAGLGGLRLSITDNFLPENSGTYEERAGVIQKCSDQNADIRLDIGACTQLVMGFLSAEELSFSARASGSPEALAALDRLYPKQQNYLNHIMSVGL